MAMMTPNKQMLATYIMNLRYRAKRARMKVNNENYIYLFKDLISSRSVATTR